MKGAKVRKCVDFHDWYDGTVLLYIESACTVNVQLINGNKEQFTLASYNYNAHAAIIPIGGIVYK